MVRILGKPVTTAAAGCLLAVCAGASQTDALSIDAAIQARHLPFGTILDPIFTSPTSLTIQGYTRCGDSALWTGAYLAAESFRYKVTQAADALANVKTALAGIKSLVDVTGDDRVARCIVPTNSPYAAGIASEEAANTIHQNPPFFWVDNTSRDQVVGVFFGLGIAFDLTDDPGVKASAAALATRIANFVALHQWTPNDDLSNTFLARPEELQMILQVTRHLNPQSTISGPVFVPPVDLGVGLDVLGVGSYFKFNLDYMTFYHLVRLQDTADNRDAYSILRSATATHQNAFFDMVDRAVNGAAPQRDGEALGLLNDWLTRQRRDFSIDVSKTVATCGSETCAPVPVAFRPPTDFLWQRDPFQISGGGSGVIESAGIDYLLPYWMGRYYGVIADEGAAVSSAAPVAEAAPGSLASIYGTSLSPAQAQAGAQPLPTNLGGASATVTDSAGVARAALLLFASAAQVNLQVPGGTAPGLATVQVTGAVAQQFQLDVQPVAPTLFSLGANGGGVAAATAVRVDAANPNLQTPVLVFTCGGSGCAPAPIALGIDTPVYVSLYGTGIRGRSSLSAVAVVINGIRLPAAYADAAPGFTGLDQINVALPLSLRGSGTVNVTVTVDGWTSNVVTLAFQ